MADPSIDIERVVQEVLARLGQTAGGHDPPPPAQSPPAQAHFEGAPAQPAEPGAGALSTLEVSSRVVTMAEVGDRLDAVRRLLVPPGAVVTPAVRDELYRRRITLVYGRLTAQSKPSQARLLLTVLGSRFEPALVTAALKGQPVEVEIHRHDCLVAATDELACQLAAPATLGVIVCTYPAVAVCLANRHPALRAVWGVDPARLAGDLDSVGANVLVVDPRGLTPYQLKQMTIQFCRKGPTDCPEALRQQLTKKQV